MNVVDFLEKMGRDAQLRHGLQKELELALGSLGFGPDIEKALLSGDHPRLETLLGQVPLCAAYFPAKEDEEQEEESEETPAREPEEGRHGSGSRIAATAG